MAAPSFNRFIHTKLRFNPDYPQQELYTNTNSPFVHIGMCANLPPSDFFFGMEIAIIIGYLYRNFFRLNDHFLPMVNELSPGAPAGG